jgi:hypothetical protein
MGEASWIERGARDPGQTDMMPHRSDNPARTGPPMNEIRGFRLMLVMLAALVIGVAGGWAFVHGRQAAAEQAVSDSFGAYNRYIAACGDGKDVAAWDLATRAYDALAQASAARDRYEEAAELLLWIGGIAFAVVLAGYYALRWAFTGNVRPLWVLGATAAAPVATLPRAGKE